MSVTPARHHHPLGIAAAVLLVLLSFLFGTGPAWAAELSSSTASQSLSAIAKVAEIEGNLQGTFNMVANNVLGMAKGLFLIGVSISLSWHAIQLVLRGNGGLEEIFAGGFGMQLVAWLFISAFLFGSPPPAAQAIAGFAGNEGWVSRVAGAVGDEVRPASMPEVTATASGTLATWTLLIERVMVSWDSATVVPDPNVLTEEEQTALEERGATQSFAVKAKEYSYRALMGMAAIFALIIVTIGFWHLVLTVMGTQLQLLIGGGVGALMLAGASTQWTMDYAQKWVTFLVSIFIKLVLIYITLGFAAEVLMDLADSAIPIYARPIQNVMILTPSAGFDMALELALGSLSFGGAAFFIITVLLMVPSAAEDIITGQAGSHSGLGAAMSKAGGPFKFPFNK